MAGSSSPRKTRLVAGGTPLLPWDGAPSFSSFGYDLPDWSRDARPVVSYSLEESVGIARPPQPRELVIRFQNDGQLDVAALETSSSRQPVKEWLRDRLEGRDVRVGLDEDGHEQPEQLFEDLWFRADIKGALRDCLDYASSQLLAEAHGLPADRWVEGLLRFVGTVRPPRCQSLLTRVVRQGDFSDEQLASGIDRRWVGAAAEYRPQSPELARVWPKLLDDERYRVVAFRALSQDIETGLHHLPRYYGALPDARRPRLLKAALRRLLTEGTTLFYARLRAQGPRYAAVDGLAHDLDLALDSLGYPTVFSAAAVERPKVAAADPPGAKLYNLAAAS